MTYPAPQKIDTATKVGWAFTGLVLVALIAAAVLIPPAPEPDPHTFKQVTDVVNTCFVVDVYKEGDFTRVQFRGNAGNNGLFVEPPSHFLGPTRIVHATRLER